MSDFDEEIEPEIDEGIDPVESEGMMLFIRRKPINGKYPIADLLDYSNVGNHGAFFKFRITGEQAALLGDRNTKFLLLDLLKADHPESTFLGEEYNAEMRDVRGYGMAIEKYVQIVPTGVEV